MAEMKLQALSEDLLQPATRRDSTMAEIGIRHVFVRDLVLPCSIGVHRHERDAPQRVRINLDLAVHEDDTPIDDSIGNVVCYEDVASGIRSIVGAGHINLVETLAERLATFCLQDVRIETVRIRVEKLDVFPDVASVGVEIVRARAV